MKRERGVQYKGKRIWAALLAATLVCGGVTGCGSVYDDKQAENYYDSGYNSETDYVESQSADAEDGISYDVEMKGNAVETSDSVSEGNSSSLEGKKIIKNYNYSYETETFDEAYVYLKQQIEAFSGYVSSSEIYGNGRRTLYLTARIPAEESDRFVGQLGSLGTMISQSESAEDITLQYTDTESRIASLKTEQERLLALLEKADSLDSIVALENRLTEVRYELENYESQKKLYDDQVAYSTVTITLEEVAYTVAVDESTFLTRIQTGLEKTFRDIRSGFVDLAVGFIVALPYLVIWGIILFVIIWFIRKMIKRHKGRKNAKRKAEKGNVNECKNIETKVSVPEAYSENMQEKKETELVEKKKKSETEKMEK